MKKKLQKYLSGEREGFSLVELIIVIAIMAILIGIIALAVIPYMEKSRVGKDQQTVDTVYSAYQSAIADAQSQGKSVKNISSLRGVTSATTDTFEKALLNNLGAPDGATICNKLISEAASGGTRDIECKYDAGTKKITVKATGVTATIESSNQG